MKKIIGVVCISLIVATLPACTQEQKQLAEVSEPAYASGSLAKAKETLAEIKQNMSKKVKAEYFESEEWHAFVKAYWNSYNEAQKSMKAPQYMDLSKIVY